MEDMRCIFLKDAITWHDVGQHYPMSAPSFVTWSFHVTDFTRVWLAVVDHVTGPICQRPDTRLLLLDTVGGWGKWAPLSPLLTFAQFPASINPCFVQRFRHFGLMNCVFWSTVFKFFWDTGTTRSLFEAGCFPDMDSRALHGVSWGQVASWLPGHSTKTADHTKLQITQNCRSSTLLT